MAVNPFIWTSAIDDGVSRGDFTRDTALVLKSGTNVALFGPRGTGKTTFLLELASELAVEQEPDAPPWETVVIDLRRAISIPAFIAAVSDALASHPNNSVRRTAEAAVGRMEKEFGVNLGFARMSLRSTPPSDLYTPELLHRQLVALTEVADRLVIAFDEFQRLASCPGEPLSIIRSALMGPSTTRRVALLLTGSLREKLSLMLHTSTEPIWDQTHDLDLPDLDRQALLEYLELRFSATGKPIDSRAVEELVALASGHPKRTQHLAWHVWQQTKPGVEINRTDVHEALNDLVSSDRYTTDFVGLIDRLLAGPDSDINDARALYLLAAGARPGSNQDAHGYGLSSASATQRALTRLKSRGLVFQQDTHWQIVDPLLREWLRRQDPLASM